MKALSIVSIVVASIGLFYGMVEMFTTEANLDEMIGYGFIGFVISGLFLAMAIVALKNSKGGK